MKDNENGEMGERKENNDGVEELAGEGNKEGEGIRKRCQERE